MMSTGGGEADDNGSTTRSGHKVSFLRLFAFADGLDYVLMGLGSIGACVNGASLPIFFLFFAKLANCMAAASPSTANSVARKVAKYSLDFVYLGATTWFSSWIEVACWAQTGERQAEKMRLAYLRSILNQEIGVFDTESMTGEVITSITNDVVTIQDAISQKVREVIGVTLSVLCSNMRLFAIFDHTSSEEASQCMVESPKRENWAKLLIETASKSALNIQSANHYEIMETLADATHENGSINTETEADLRRMETTFHFVISSLKSGRSSYLLDILVGLLYPVISLQVD